ncbi:nuclear transport factor 2 family protein [Amycolatopsis thermophila]|uniref:Ketosteroid isomerase-like protein n=1 Tax=Amycolatopsis thermophila TaxID=206084 RepID=A0ABU0F4W0_9PSEU|nr:nuclear transport factor 2 family protein [Amycolatopsis thermophila]MDQ0382087.1 ketosteroid isomerase-like protein [Amycolatopsis thermophila]
MTDLPAAVRRMFDATNRGDSEAFLDAFTEDGQVDDWGRTFTGRDELAGWNDRENIGVQAHFDVTGSRTSGDTTTVTLQVSGNGFNGPGTFEFVVRDDRIARLRIR